LSWALERIFGYTNNTRGGRVLRKEGEKMLKIKEIQILKVCERPSSSTDLPAGEVFVSGP
jgi:hypothetical protein